MVKKFKKVVESKVDVDVVYFFMILGIVFLNVVGVIASLVDAEPFFWICFPVITFAFLILPLIISYFGDRKVYWIEVKE